MPRWRPFALCALLLLFPLAGCRIDGPVYLDSPRLAPPCDCGPVALAPARPPATPGEALSPPAVAVPALDPASRSARRARVALDLED